MGEIFVQFEAIEAGTQLSEALEKIKKEFGETVVVRHEEPVVTRSDDTIQIYYCAHCWDNESRLFQVGCSENGTFMLVEKSLIRS